VISSCHCNLHVVSRGAMRPRAPFPVMRHCIRWESDVHGSFHRRGRERQAAAPNRRVANSDGYPSGFPSITVR
jgi:hypothetical protein